MRERVVQLRILETPRMVCRGESDESTLASRVLVQRGSHVESLAQQDQQTPGSGLPAAADQLHGEFDRAHPDQTPQPLSIGCMLAWLANTSLGIREGCLVHVRPSPKRPFRTPRSRQTSPRPYDAGSVRRGGGPVVDQARYVGVDLAWGQRSRRAWPCWTAPAAFWNLAPYEPTRRSWRPPSGAVGTPSPPRSTPVNAGLETSVAREE